MKNFYLQGTAGTCINLVTKLFLCMRLMWTRGQLLCIHVRVGSVKVLVNLCLITKFKTMRHTSLVNNLSVQANLVMLSINNKKISRDY